MKKKYIIFLAITFILLAIVAAMGFAVLQTKKHANLPRYAPPVTICFAHVQRNRERDSVDKTVLKLTVGGDKVAGVLNLVPAEKDAKIGSFSGTIDQPNLIGLIDSRIAGSFITSLWQASVEGVTTVEELFMRVSDPGNGKPTVAIGFGEMGDRGDGTYRYTNPDAIDYSLVLQEADCSTLENPIPTLLHEEAAIAPVDYTKPLDTKYVTAASIWPPKVTVTTGGKLTCKNQKDIGGSAYCIDKKTEGAAGNFYTTYTYKTLVGEQLANATFTLRSVQCGSYDEPQQSECRIEQASFDVDSLADGLIHQLVK